MSIVIDITVVSCSVLCFVGARSQRGVIGSCSMTLTAVAKKVSWARVQTVDRSVAKVVTGCVARGRPQGISLKVKHWKMVFDQKMARRLLRVVTELLSWTKTMNLQVLFVVAWTWSWRGTGIASAAIPVPLQ